MPPKKKSVKAAVSRGQKRKLNSDKAPKEMATAKSKRAKAGNKPKQAAPELKTGKTEGKTQLEKVKSAENTAGGTTTESSTASGRFLKPYLTDLSWIKHLQEEMDSDYFQAIENLLKKDYATKEIFPPKEQIFRALNMCPMDKTKVVILGQDPYHDNGQACGMSFSVPKGVDAPPSLKNIYKELTTDITGLQTPNHGCLDKWASDGVLLLNATLTVEAHQPNSHKKYGWQKFTDSVIRKLSTECNGIVFILWGAFAHKKEALIDAKKNGVIKTAHPSGCSFYLFRGCKCFSQANKLLAKYGRVPLDWSL